MLEKEVSGDVFTEVKKFNFVFLLLLWFIIMNLDLESA